MRCWWPIDLDEILEVRKVWQFFRDRRPESYGVLTSQSGKGPAETSKLPREVLSKGGYPPAEVVLAIAGLQQLSIIHYHRLSDRAISRIWFFNRPHEQYGVREGIADCKKERAVDDHLEGTYSWPPVFGG